MDEARRFARGGLIFAILLHGTGLVLFYAFNNSYWLPILNVFGLTATVASLAIFYKKRP